MCWTLLQRPKAYHFLLSSKLSRHLHLHSSDRCRYSCYDQQSQWKQNISFVNLRDMNKRWMQNEWEEERKIIIVLWTSPWVEWWSSSSSRGSDAFVCVHVSMLPHPSANKEFAVQFETINHLFMMSWMFYQNEFHLQMNAKWFCDETQSFRFSPSETSTLLALVVKQLQVIK